MWLVRQSQACSSACFLCFAPVSMGCQCVYPYIRHRVVSGATWATTRTRNSIVPWVYVVEEQKTYSYGMARHGTRIGGVYICALSSSPTEDYWDLDSVHRISKSRGQGVTYEMYSVVFITHVPGTYVYRIRWKVDRPLVSGIIIYPVDSIGYKGRTW